MKTGGIENIKNFDQLIPFLRDELDWPLDEDYDFEDFVYDYDAVELGLKPDETAKIREIHQLRPLSTDQSWGIFFISFEEKKIPVGVLKRILGGLTLKKRQSDNKADQKGWDENDLLFISAFGQSGERELSFLHFSEEHTDKKKTVLKELGWDKRDTKTKQAYVYNTLKKHLAWPEDSEGFKSWTNAFTIGHGEAIATTKVLTKRLAELASGIREAAQGVLTAENQNGSLTKIFNDFKKTIFHNLTKDDFADMYAQTICYGLLSVQIARTQKGLDAKTLSADDAALEDMQVMQPFLKDLMESFLAIGGRKNKVDFNELGINEVVELLQSANMQAVVLDFGNNNPNEDPILHFYEHFLKEYDGLMRKNRGVYYTPLPVVRFIVRSVDEILQKEFGLEDGLADTATWGEMHAKISDIIIPEGVEDSEPFVQILDPATGTGTFLVETIGLIEKRMKDKWQEAGKKTDEIQALWNDYVPQHLLPRLNGFELMMAPYAIAHIKIGMKLAETGYQPKDDEEERVRVYLTNTLEKAIHSRLNREETTDLFATVGVLEEEAKGANKIKADTPITVIVGNPPYSNFGQLNKGLWIKNAIADYKLNLNEQKINLDDDYIKFFRWMQLIVDKSLTGVLGIISNHTHIDGLTHRRMRESLKATFSKLYNFELNGSIKKRTAQHDLKKDENVFDIQQGVAISLFTKIPCAKHTIKYFSLLGTKKDKIIYLNNSNMQSINWNFVKSNSPAFHFSPFNNKREPEWNQFISIVNILNVNSSGIKTHLDPIFVGFSDDLVVSKTTKFLEKNATPTEIKNTKRSSKERKANLLNKSISSDTSQLANNILPYQYRSLDQRSVLYIPNAIEAGDHRWAIMRHFVGGSIGFSSTRQTSKGVFNHALICSGLVDMCYLSTATKECAYCFPLYLMPSATETEIRPNLASDFTTNIAFYTGLNYIGKVLQESDNMGRGDLAKAFGPRDVLDYIYTVLHSPTYRTRYVDFLKSDFPRIPLPNSVELFRDLVALGGQLVSLHLLNEKEATSLAKPDTRFVKNGDARVEKGYPKYENGKVMINASCYFEDVTSEVWNFYIGGYQVCHKWLKDRAGKGGKNPHPGRILSEDDILHYRRITIAIRETIRLMKEVDDTINKYGGWPDAFYTPPPPPPTIEEIIGADEGQELEFKSTFQWDVREEKKNKDLQKSCLKTIAAFLNTKGGVLVIGVADDKQVFGLEEDLKLTRDTTDQFEQTLRQAMDNTLAASIAPYCTIRFAESIDKKQVCIVEVEKSKQPVFLKWQGKEEFFIRSGNATKSLAAADQHDFIKQHFPA